MKMMSEVEFRRQLDKVANAKTKRDDEIAASKERFIQALIAGYRAGLTITDLRDAAGISATSIHKWFNEREVKETA